MADQFTREELVLLDDVTEAFDADNTISKEAARFTQPGDTMQRTGDQIWRPVPMISTTVSGLDITGNIGSVTDLAVPATLSTIDNVPFDLDALQMREPRYRERKAKSAAQALSAKINVSMANNVRTWIINGSP